jgi:hypothetical protein
VDPESGTERRARLLTFKDKLDALASFVNRVGLPTFLVLVAVTLAVGTYTGYFTSPFLSLNRAEQMVNELAQIHLRQIELQKQGMEVSRETMQAIKELRCEMKRNDKERLDCYRKNKQSYEESHTGEHTMSLEQLARREHRVNPAITVR